jgi:hypothetical protein
MTLPAPDMSKLQYITQRQGPIMASCISRFKSEDFKKYNILSGYVAGRKVDFDVPGPIGVHTDRKKLISDYMDVEGVSFVSSRFRSFIEAFEIPNVEFLPAAVELFDRKVSLGRPKVHVHGYPPGDVGGGKVLHDYWWMNLWNKVDAIDRGKSIGAWMPGLNSITVRSFPDEQIPDHFLPEDGRQRIVLKTGIRDHLFRVEGLHGDIFVSPEFSQAMTQAELVVGVSDFPMRRGVE